MFAKRQLQINMTLLVGLLLLFAPIRSARAEIVIVETPSHNMGTGAEGSFFQKSFSMPAQFSAATLEFDITGPNYESSPYAEINGHFTGSIQPFFPGVNQTNPDGSHDYNGWFHISLSVTNFLTAGNNVFTWHSGRPDDHYTFANVYIQFQSSAPSGPPLYVVTDLGTVPGKAQSSAYALNNLGTVVGVSGNDLNLYTEQKGFMWNPSSPNATSGMVNLLNLPNAGTLDINDAGMLAGTISVGPDANNLIYHAVTDDSAGIHDLGNLGGQSSIAYKINDSGQVVGVSETSFTDDFNGIVNHAFLKNPGQSMIDIGKIDITYYGNDFSSADGINEYGQITGQSSTITHPHAFLWQPSSPNATQGAFTDLATLPGDLTSFGYFINNYGQVVGRSIAYNVVNDQNIRIRHGFLWTPNSANSTTGTMVSIGALPNDPVSEAYAINFGGQVVGYAAEKYDQFTGQTTNPLAIIWNPVTPHGTTGAISDLNSYLPPNSGWTLQYAAGINDAGQITGQGLLHGQVRGFLLTPIQKLAFAPSFTRSSTLTARVTVTNQGLGPVKLRASSAILGNKATTTALSTVYPLAVGGLQTVGLNFPLSVGASGTRTLLKITWQTASGSFTNFYRVTLP